MVGIFFLKTMLQRIQTIYLLIATVISVLLLIMPIYYVNLIGDDTISGIFGAYGLQSEASENINLPLYLVFILMAMLSIIAIFSFKKRSKQLLFCRLNLLLQILVGLGFLAFSFFGKDMLKDKFVELGYPIDSIEFSFGLGYFLLFMGIPFIILAINGIKRDENLLKSLERLR